MSFYSIYCLAECIELYALERETLAVSQEGRLISTHQGYQRAYASAVALAAAKQLPLVDRVQSHDTSRAQGVPLSVVSTATVTSVGPQRDA